MFTACQGISAMLISASRRTDIPAHYADWFFARLQAGFVDVRNPMNPRRVSRISLDPDVVDGIVLWTKNPLPMLERLHLLTPYPYYFQFTLTPYGQDIEPSLPSKSAVLVPAFQRLAERIGSDRIIWRYDPILLNEKYTLNYHLTYFNKLVQRLDGCTQECTFSFLDSYKSTRSAGLRKVSACDMHTLAREMAAIAHAHHMALSTCAEEIDLSAYDIRHAKCVDAARFERITGIQLRIGRDKNQRAACGCDESIDIGAYNCCPNACRYCYANYQSSLVPARCVQHDPASSMLIGHLDAQDTLTHRPMRSCRMQSQQLSFTDT